MVSKILCVSDTHTGGRYSVSSEYNGKLQRWFFKQWEYMCDDVGKVDAVFHLGDVCEGVDKHNDGAGTWESDMLRQAEDAKTLLEMIHTKKYWIVDGSPYHTNKNMSADGVVSKLVNGNFDIEHLVSIEDTHIHLRHFTPFSELPHASGNGLGKDMMWASLCVGQYGAIDLLVRGHVHRYELKGNAARTSFSVPCWKGRDEYIKRKSLSVTDCGYVVLEVSGKNYSYDLHPIHVPKEFLISETRL